MNWKFVTDKCDWNWSTIECDKLTKVGYVFGITILTQNDTQWLKK